MRDVIPDKVGIFDRHPGRIEITGFLPDLIRDLPEWHKKLDSDFLRDHQR
jgi:hypothetical protein